MASSLHQWESDPLFSAAEVVQDSADRMESVLRSLLHELSLVQGDRPDPKLHVSIDYRKRDLATTLETAKWQLEDFERAVAGRSQNREDVIPRHKQFIGAMREQILYVEKSLEGTPIGDPMRNTEWVNLNEQDRDGLALFLSGGNNAEPTDGQEVEDSSILRRFLDPTTSSAKDSTSGIVEHKSRKIEDLNTNGVVHVDRVIESRKENNLGKVGSNNKFGEGGSWDIGNTRLKSDFTDSFPQTSCNRYGGGESRDLEANEAKPESFSRTNVLGFLNTAWSVYGSRVTGSYTKRFKDGEEQSHSPSIADVSHGAQVQHQRTWLYRNFKELCMGIRTKVMYLRTWLGVFRARYERSPHHIQVQRHSIPMAHWFPSLFKDIRGLGTLYNLCLQRVFSRLFNVGRTAFSPSDPLIMVGCKHYSNLEQLCTIGHRVITRGFQTVRCIGFVIVDSATSLHDCYVKNGAVGTSQ